LAVHLRCSTSLSLDELTASDAVTVRGGEAEFSESPGLVGRHRSDESTFDCDLVIEIVDVIHVPVGEVRMVSELVGWSGVGAFAKHDAEGVAGEERPAVGVNGIFVEAEDVYVIVC